MHSGDQTFCWLYQDGHARRVEIQTGVSDGEWIEVTNLERPRAKPTDHPWKRINGSEQVILGDLSTLADGAPVKVASAQGQTEVASTANPLETATPPVAGIRE